MEHLNRLPTAKAMESKRRREGYDEKWRTAERRERKAGQGGPSRTEIKGAIEKKR